MNFIIILGIAGCGVLLNRAILIYLRKKYTQQLIKAIQSRNETEYQRLVFSKSARILMEPNVVNPVSYTHLLPENRILASGRLCPLRYAGTLPDVRRGDSSVADRKGGIRRCGSEGRKRRNMF